MFGRMVLGDVVCQVGFPWFPVYLKLVLFYPVSDPVKSHINSLRSLDFDAVVGYATCGGVVYLDWGGWLWVLMRQGQE